jgi:O-antigen/teichoic acid export membrane protein
MEGKRHRPGWAAWHGDSIQSFVLRSSVGTAALKVAYMGLALATSLVLARAMSADGFGLYSLALAMATLLAVPIKLGIPNLLVREVAKYADSGAHGLLKGILLRANQAVLLSVLVLGLLLFLLLQLGLGDLVGWGGGTIYWLALVAVPLMAFNAIRAATLRGLHRVLVGQLPESVIQPAAFLAIVSVVLWVGDLTPTKAMAVQIASLVLGFALGTTWLLKELPAESRYAAPTFDTRRWLCSIAPLSLLEGMRVINNQAGLVLLGYFDSHAAVGNFRVATQISNIVAFASSAGAIAVAPRMSKLYHKGNLDELQKMVRTTSLGTFLFSLPIVACLSVWGDVLLGKAFGEAFRVSYPAMVILCVGQLFNSFTGAVTTLLNMTGNEVHAARGMAVAAMSNVVLCVLLIPFMGVLGAAIASSFTLVLWNGLLYRQCLARTGIDTAAVSLFHRGRRTRGEG